MPITYTDRKNFDVEKLQALFNRGAEWAKERPLDKLRIMVEHSVISTAWDGERLVGFARAVTDHVYRAFIEDVVVDPDYYLQGIGTEIMNRLMTSLEAEDVPQFELWTHIPEFYERMGYCEKPNVSMVRTVGDDKE
jgi:GNAT superfamily N-acetyltransferase